MDLLQQSWDNLKSASLENKKKAFIGYCENCIKEKEKGNFREEEVAYKICGSGFIEGLEDIPEIKEIVDHSCDMEILRETSVGSGIHLEDQWRQEDADRYKQKEWDKLMELINKLK